MWPTPTASSYGSSNNGCPGDGREEYATKGRPSLQRMVVELPPWPTPTREDSHASGVAGNWTPESGRHAGTTLTDAAVREGRRSSAGLMLNPRWIEALMGFPMGWCLLPTGQTSLFDGPPDAGSLSTAGSHPAPCGATACPTMRPR
ncbi:MAG: hypothetical protein ACMG6S_33520 [Byssovorax sp.]